MGLYVAKTASSCQAACVKDCDYTSKTDYTFKGESVAQSESTSSLSKAKVKHDGAWSPNGWVTVTCYLLCARPEISAESNSVQTLS